MDTLRELQDKVVIQAMAKCTKGIRVHADGDQVEVFRTGKETGEALIRTRTYNTTQATRKRLAQITATMPSRAYWDVEYITGPYLAIEYYWTDPKGGGDG